ncbi:MAG: hypothetical protein ACJAW3_000101 [Lentimonas sp.]|jgi:hypothetical protein
MTKKIVLSFITITIISFAAFGAFWLVKTNTIKKHLAAFQAPGFFLTSSSVSVSGFPLKQNFSVKNLIIKPSAPEYLDDNLDIDKDKKSALNNNSLNIPSLNLSAGIFSNNFSLTIKDDLKIGEENEMYDVKFNQIPLANIIIEGTEVTRFSYQGQGYKISDAENNVVFENGSSKIDFSLIVVENQKIAKLLADFKEMGDLFSLEQLDSEMKRQSDLLEIVNSIDKNAETNSPEDKNEMEQILLDITEARTDKTLNYQDLTIRNIHLDLELFLENNSNKNSNLPDLGNGSTDNLTPFEHNAIKSVKINNVELSNPIYKFNINGNLSNLDSKDSEPSFNLSLKVEEYETVLTYLQQAVNNFENLMHYISKKESEDKNLEEIIAVAPAELPEVSEQLIEESTSQIEDQNITPEEDGIGFDVVKTIREVAQKNIATGERIAIFDFGQDANGSVIINNIPFLEIMLRSITAAADEAGVNESSDPTLDDFAIDPVLIENSAPIPQLTPIKISPTN